ncbi:GNAT family N-acetyltransferase [Paraburkholderia sp. J12]|uniref:GNAT family N-acetyltransferase n=1 Tax=Paraburkholderia sp. J12 TaxID=2805432 RepID=UPI002ABD52DA|nr:GNAT family N-acetyltransferase [Paraburkholderia sp. J12]
MSDRYAMLTIKKPTGEEAEALVPALADVLIDCVEGGASVSFMLPLSRDTALNFWRGVARGVAQGERILLVAQDNEGRIVGTVQIVTAQPENQPHRADIAKMLVSRHARRQGVAQRLMAAADEAAREAGKTVLVLDTVTGGDAERLYQRAGWQRVGSVPKYALMPDGAFCATTFYYKHLA